MTHVNTGVDPLRFVRRWFEAWVAALKDRRECPRISVPLVAHYWNGGISQAYEVKAVSRVGAYLVTPDRWFPGTILRLSVSRPSASMADGETVALMVRARIVRIGADGVGIRLVYLNKKERKSFEKFLAAAPGRVA